MALTTADIHAAADRLQAEGQTPTLAAVRSALGGGSFTTISEAMKPWKAAQQAAAAPVREAAPEAVGEKAAQLAADVWAIAQAMATERLERERKALDATRQELEQQQREAAELADQLAAELDVARAQIEQQTQALRQAEAQAAQLAVAQGALAEVQKRADNLGTLLEQEREALKDERIKRELAQQEAARLAGRLEAQKAKK